MDQQVIGRVGQRHQTLESMVCEQLRTWIVTGHLVPGERLVESGLADELGVSRAPVRTAIRQLVREGFVVLAPRKGAAVAEVSVKEALECYEVRIALEGVASRLAATRRTADDLAVLERLVAEGEAAIRAGQWQALATLNNDFHSALATAAANAELVSLMGQYAMRIAWIFSRAAERRGAPAWEEHAEIVVAVRDGDDVRSEHLARRHIEQSRAQFLIEVGATDDRRTS